MGEENDDNEFNNNNNNYKESSIANNYNLKSKFTKLKLDINEYNEVNLNPNDIISSTSIASNNKKMWNSKLLNLCDDVVDHHPHHLDSD